MSNSGIVALYMTSQEKTKRDVQDRIEFEYFDKDSFRTFDLFLTYVQFFSLCIRGFYLSKRKIVERITTEIHRTEKQQELYKLRKSLIKNEKHLALIKVSWSPQFCLLYRKTNIYDLTNNKVPLYDKLVTFEGPEHLAISGIY